MRRNQCRHGNRPIAIPVSLSLFCAILFESARGDLRVEKLLATAAPKSDSP